jgi:hypothetical protein
MAKKEVSGNVNELNPFGFQEVEVDIEKLKKHSANPRKISKRNQMELRQSMERFGLLDKPIVNADFTIIAGHQRIEILAQKDIKRVKVMMPEIQLDEAQVLELLIRHNKNTGEWDFEKLASFDTDQLLNFGFDYNELNKVIDENKEEFEAENAEPEFPITPRMSEKHSYVIIMVDNEIEKANLETLLELEEVRDYKTQRIGTGRVLTFDKFKKAFDNSVEAKLQEIRK